MIEAKQRIYLTDGEGPVIFKDLARDISLKRLPSNFFDIASMWVAQDTEKQVHVFEPGDTLAIIVPNLIAHGVTDEDLSIEAASATIATGIKEHLSNLGDVWKKGIVSSAYVQLWNYCGPLLGIDCANISSTDLNLANIKKQHINGKIKKAVLDAEEAIAKQNSVIESAIADFKAGVSLEQIFQRPEMQPVKSIFEELYFSTLPRLEFSAIDEVSVIGGTRKVEAVKKIVAEEGVSISEVVYVGDSITDDKVHKLVKDYGGLSIAVNADEFAIRNAMVAIATEDMQEIKPIVDAWVRGGFDCVRMLAAEGQFTQGKERGFQSEERKARISIVTPQSVESTTAIHREYRAKIRGAAIPLL